MKKYLNSWKWWLGIGVMLMAFITAWGLRMPAAAQNSENQTVRIEYVYDSANRLIGVNYSDGKSIRYTYDANGNRLERKIIDNTTVAEWQNH